MKSLSKLTRALAVAGVSAMFAGAVLAAPTAPAAPKAPASNAGKVPAALAAPAAPAANVEAPGVLLKELEKARVAVVALAAEVSQLDERIAAAKLERKKLDTSSQALRKEWERRLGNAKRARQKYDKEAARPVPGPAAKTALETASTEYDAALTVAAELGKQRAALAAIDKDLDQQAKLAEQLRVRGVALSDTLRGAEAPLGATLQRLDGQAAALSKAAGMVKDQTGFGRTGSLATAQKEGTRKLGLAATALADVETRLKAVEQKLAEPPPAPPAPDLLGVKLGMTPEQALAALKQSAPRYEIDASYTSPLHELRRASGRVTKDTKDRYLPQIFGSATIGDTSYTARVSFGLPPQQNVVIKVDWSSAGPQGNQALQSHLSAQASKRGKPSGETASPLSATREAATSLKWVYGPEKQDCVQLRAAGLYQWPSDTTKLSVPKQDCAPALVHNVYHWQGKLRRTDTSLAKIGLVLVSSAENQAYLEKLDKSLGRHPSQAYGPAQAPSFGPGKCDIKKLDWKNFTYPECDGCGFSGVSAAYALKNGEYQSEGDESGDQDEAFRTTVYEFSEVKYEDKNGNGRPEANVGILAGGVGMATMSGSLVYTFEYDAKCELQFLRMTKL